MQNSSVINSTLHIGTHFYLLNPFYFLDSIIWTEKNQVILAIISHILVQQSQTFMFPHIQGSHGINMTSTTKGISQIIDFKQH